MSLNAFKPAPIFKSNHLSSSQIGKYSELSADSSWLNDWRTRSLQTFDRVAPPVRNDEIWRRVDLNRFKLQDSLQTIECKSAAIDKNESWSVHATADKAPGWMFHSNGTCLAQRLSPELVSKGVIFSSIENASREHSGLLARYLMTQCVKPTDTFMAAMHATLIKGGVVLYVPKGVQIEAPLRAATWLTADQPTAFHHTLVVLEDGARATLIEEFASPTNDQSGAQAMVNSSVELLVGNGAHLDYVSIQDFGRHTYNFSTERAKVGSKSTLHWVLGSVGSRFTKSAIEADMLGEGSTALLSGVYFADAKQQMHYDTQQNHIAGGCKSDLLYKAALRDDARTVWRGNIRVFPGAQKTDSYQANRNLQLSEHSRADSIPGLEIEADDVRCTHGATVGQIEKEPMFYLESRGINPMDARRLIVEGFFAPVIERIPLDETRQRLIDEIGKKIG